MPRKIKVNILESLGGTPLVKLSKLPRKRVGGVFAKVESLNPGGSVKDRIAWSMVLDAERKGLLARGGTIVEPTSGNTGIGLAMVGAVRGYRVILVLTDSISFERYHLLHVLRGRDRLQPCRARHARSGRSRRIDDPGAPRLFYAAAIQ